MTPLTVNQDRVLKDIAELASFGGREDGGVDRVAGSAEDLAAREWLARRIQDAGLEAWTDKTGNVFGRQKDSSGPFVLTGSHTDTVPAGGRLDGAYGVIAALEALRVLHENGHPAAAAVEIVSFWDEEGVASGGGLHGSTALCNSDHILDVAAFVELHIEQGPRMERKGLSLAVVEGIVGIDRYTVTVRGEANHAGTTPMDLRTDAGRVAARIVGDMHEMALGVDSEMVVNVGVMEFHPGSPNVIPGEAQFVTELRAPTDELLVEAARQLEALCERHAGPEGCLATLERRSHKPVAEFDSDVLAVLSAACDRQPARVGHLSSYAGHDAGPMSAVVPTGMLFVPSSGGISHSPAECTPDASLVQGVQALLEALVDLERAFCRRPPASGRRR
ncbi:M20/M25/M40 family metallo-hydrolase [Streptomyces sp. NPDC051172]|uniref:M20/M25/M40 family metallo-hydrolase n=1 Tax=Streptomyces sp. NPDC051172 TaxID=3155796 RepID=UPI003420070B